MAEQSLIERLRQDYFDSLSERWNTDGTRKVIPAGIMLTDVFPDGITATVGLDVMRAIAVRGYSPLNPDVAKLKYGEVDFCDQ